MDKFNLVGVTAILFIATAFIILYQTDIAEALYSIPPTNAFKTVSIANNVTYTPSFETNVTAINYRDNFWLVTDGSILLNITTYP